MELECTFSPSINPNSERLLEDSRAVPSDFLARQRFFHDLKQQKLRHLQQTVVLHLFSKTRLLNGAAKSRIASQRISLF